MVITVIRVHFDILLVTRYADFVFAVESDGHVF